MIRKMRESLPHFKKSDRLVCFVLLDAISPVFVISTSFHVASDKSNIFLNVLSSARIKIQHNDCLLNVGCRFGLYKIILFKVTKVELIIFLNNLK